MHFAVIKHHTNGMSGAPRRAAPRRAAPRRALWRLSALCRACAAPRHQSSAHRPSTKRSTSGGTRLGSPLISGEPNRGLPKKTKTKRATRRNEEQTRTVDGITLATSSKLKDDNVAQQTKHGQETVSAPVHPKYNVGMHVTESVLRNLSSFSALTLRPLYATQHRT